ncbi:MAG: DUF99 family protein [Thermoplasmatales archaeon]
MDLNSLFNKDARIMAFDDAPFSRGQRSTSIVGLIMRKDMYIESVLKDRISVDGDDSTDVIISMVERKGSGISIIMTQGITFGGFNILDVNRLFTETGIPVVNVVDHKPDIDGMKDALVKHFTDWERRIHLLRGEFTEYKGIFIQTSGIGPIHAYRFIKQVTLAGNLPEPLRLVNMIAGIVN